MANDSCNFVKTLLTLEERCDFVRNTADCDQLDSGFLSYNEFVYCNFESEAGPVILIVLWLVILLLTLATTADSFFGSCLIVITHTLHLSQNLAGVTLLAFGNGAADVFSSLSSISSSSPGIAFGSLLGAGILVNTVTAGMIMIVMPFTTMRRPILKDTAFYFVSVVWALIILIKREIHLGEAIGFLLLYVVYVIVTIVSRTVYTRSFTLEVEDSVEMKEMEEEDGKGVSNDGFLEVPGEAPKSKRFQQLDEPNVAATGGLSPVGRRREMNLSKISRTSRGSSRRSRESSGGAERDYSVRKRRGQSTSSYAGIGYMARWIMVHKPEEEDYYKFKRDQEDLKSIAQESRRRTQSTADRLKDKLPEVRGRAQTSGADFVSEPKLTIKNQLSPRYSKKKSSNRVSRMDSIESVDVGQLDKDDANAIAKWTAKGIENEGYSKETDEPDNLQTVDITDKSQIEKLEIEKEKEEEEEEMKFPGQWKWLIMNLIPFSMSDWADMSWPIRILEIIRAPLTVILKLFIPKVDEEMYLGGWCRPLNCFHCVSCLLCIMVIVKKVDVLISGVFPIAVIVLLIGLIMAVVVWFTSVPEKPPVYHSAFSFFGFILSIFWIYAIANEIVNILTTLGIVLKISPPLLGLSLLAWANSVSDILSNVILARNNFPRIAFAACVGGPLFNILIGIGLPFTIKMATLRSVTIPVRFTLVSLILTVTVLIVLIVHVIAMFSFRFKMNKYYGLMLIGIYVAFIILAILGETGVIPTPSTLDSNL